MPDHSSENRMLMLCVQIILKIIEATQRPELIELNNDFIHSFALPEGAVTEELFGISQHYLGYCPN